MTVTYPQVCTPHPFAAHSAAEAGPQRSSPMGPTCGDVYIIFGIRPQESDPGGRKAAAHGTTSFASCDTDSLLQV